jgi:hypothetical protein
MNEKRAFSQDERHNSLFAGTDGIAQYGRRNS